MEGIKRINTARSPKTPRNHHGSPTFEQLLQGDRSKWSATSSPLAKEHDQEDHLDHQHKKSVLTKVKDKAKQLKHSLGKKKHGHEDTGSPSSPVALDDEEENDKASKYPGAPMYKSEQAPEACKETIRQQPRAVPIVSEKHILTSSVAAENENQHENDIMTKYKMKKAQINQNNDTIAEAKKGDVSGVDETQNSERGGQKTWDKGVSVKEYLMQKFEPGENEKALSQVITEAISPRKTPGRETGVVKMVREAVTSLLRNEGTASQPTLTSSSPLIPVSTHPQQVTEEENHGRILQTN